MSISNFSGVRKSSFRMQNHDGTVDPLEKESTGDLYKSYPLNFFAPLVKVDASRREVHGVIAEEQPDKSGEIFDYGSSKPYVKQWSDDAAKRSAGTGQEISYGNVRGQHSGNIAAGKLTGITFDDLNKRILVVAKIVDPAEWQKVVEGVYTGFSIGGKYLKKWADGLRTRYTAQPTEVSIVDNPAMYGATFSLVKADGGIEKRRFHAGSSSELSDYMAEVRVQLEALTKQVLALLERRGAAPASTSPSRFQANDPGNPVAKAALEKALANPIRPPEGDLAKGTPPFQIVQEVAPGQRLRKGTPLNSEETQAASEELSKALANGKPAFRR